MERLPRTPSEAPPMARLDKDSETAESKIRLEIETKILPPEDHRLDYFVTPEFFGTVNGLLAQAGHTVAEGGWQELNDIRLKRTEASAVIVWPQVQPASGLTPTVFEGALSVEQAVENAANAGKRLHARELCSLPLSQLVPDEANAKRLVVALRYLGFSVEEINDRLVVNGYEDQDRSVRFRTVSSGTMDTPAVKFNVKGKMKSKGERGKVMNRPETPDVELKDTDLLTELLEQVGYTTPKESQKLRRSWILPAQEYMGADGRMRRLKKPVSIEINWPPGDLPPWIELESTEKNDEVVAKNDIKNAAKLLGFSKDDLKPIGTSELLRVIAEQRDVTLESVQETARRFTPQDREKMAARIADLQKLEKDLQSAFETP